MSRIGNKIIPVIDGVKVSVSGETINVEGPKGKLAFPLDPALSLAIDEGEKTVSVSRSSDVRTARAMHGLTRAVIANMIIGVKDGYEKKARAARRGLRLQAGWQDIVVTRWPSQ